MEPDLNGLNDPLILDEEPQRIRDKEKYFASTG